MIGGCVGEGEGSGMDVFVGWAVTTPAVSDTSGGVDVVCEARLLWLQLVMVRASRKIIQVTL
jgi:hypothetical protein